MKSITMNDVGEVMQELMGDRFTSRYHDQPYNCPSFMATDKKFSLGTYLSLFLIST